MIATGFDEENGVLDTPVGMSSEDVEPLSVWKGSVEGTIPVVISCWKMTAEELEEVNRTGRVWLLVMGKTMQPACLRGTSPFKAIDKESI